MAQILGNPMVWAAFALGIGLAIWSLSRLRQGPDIGGGLTQLQQIQAELSGKIGLLTDAQANLQRLVAEQLQGQERNLSKNMHDGLSDLKSRLAVFDAAQEKIAQLSAQVVSLQDILSNTKARGAFGEVQLQDLIADLLPSSVYAFQETLSNGTRVDCLLRLPNPPGSIAVDAKFPLDGYRALLAAKDDLARKEAERNFTAHMKKHIDDIAKKYIIAGETAESALLFLPSESVFAELHVNFDSLLQYSYQKRVWITSPSTMMALLNTVRAVLRDVQMREQAHIIQREVKILLDDVQRLEDRAQKLETHFGQTAEDLRQLRVSTDKINKRGQKIADLEVGETPEKSVISLLKVVE